MNVIDYLNLPACMRLAIALAHFLWQGLVLALLTVIAAKLFGRHSSRIRYMAYVTCLFGMVIALCMTYILLDVPAKTIAEESLFKEESNPAKSQLVLSTSEPTLSKTIEPIKTSSIKSTSETEVQKSVTSPMSHSSIDWQHYVPYAVSLYFLGVIVMLGRLSIGLQGGQRLRKFSQPVDNPVVAAALARQAQALGMAFTPAIAYCKRVIVPTVVGVLKPAILLPFSFASGLSPQQVEMLLTHELAHIHRYDPLINVIQKIVEALLFFHPAVWFISHRARIERENCCDDIVVGAGGKAAEYAASLVKMAEKMMVSKQGVLVEGVCATGCPSRLKQRILRLIGRPTCQQVRLTNVWAVVLALLVISFFALTTFPGNRPEGTKRDSQEVEVRTGLPVQEQKVSVAGESSGLRAILTAKQLSIVPGKPVVVELSLENVSEEEITYVDFKTHFFFDDREVTNLFVDGRPVSMHILLDINDEGYKVIAEHKPDNVATEGFVSYTPLPIPREAFVVLKPGEKVAYLKVDLQPVQFKHETSKQALGPLQIPGEHTIQVEYHNRADGRQFGLSAWTGKVNSNVVTVRVTGALSSDELKPQISNLLSKLEKLEDEHLKIRKEKVESMSDAEKRRLITHNMAISSGLEKDLNTLARETANQVTAFGEPAVSILLEELAVLSSESHYQRRCIARSLRQIGRPAVPYLIKAFQGPGAMPKVPQGKYEKVAVARYKYVIISTLGDIGDSRAVDPLLDAFQEPKTSSVLHTQTIATALGLIGDQRAVEPIIGALEDCLKVAENSGDWDKEGYNMRAYVEALGRLGDKRAIPVLRRVLSVGPQTTKAGEQYLVAEEAARSLRSLGLEVTGDREKGGYGVIETTPPDEASQALKEYLRCVEQSDAKSLEELLCFNDERDRELFIAFSSSRGKIYVRPELFPHGRPVEQKRAADDCWIVVLEDGHLLELWKVDGEWKVLCPFPGRKRMAEAKLTRAETYRYLLAEEIKQVESEGDVQLQRRRQRYLAVLDLSGRHQIKHLSHYFSGIPTDDPAILSGMSNEQFRESVILKLDAPDGLRFRVDPEQKALLEGKPVFVTFFIENVTSGDIILEYRPAVEIVDFSNAITARGALVFPRGEKTTELIISPYGGKLAYPLKKREVKIAPGATFTMRVNLLEYYDLPPARYTISSRIDIGNTEQGYWRGHAMSDTTPFEIMPLPATGFPDPNTAIVAGKVTDTATGKGVGGIPIVLGGRAVTATLPDGTYRATNVAPGPTSVGARDRDWYIVPHRRGAISAYYGRVQYEKVNLEAGKETHLDMQVTKGGKIKGTVRDALGKAVPGTIIWIINQREDSSIVAAETREFGNFTSYGLAPDIPLELLVWTSDGRGSARRTITLEAGETREVDFILDPENEYRIVGKVSDLSGSGVPNLPMRCWWREHDRRCHRSLHTDENGNFFFSGLEPGMEYEVYAYGKSAGFDTVNKSVRIPANERTAPLYLHLRKREEEPAAAAIYKKEDVSVGAERCGSSISGILLRFYSAVEKAYADVGLSKEQVYTLFSAGQDQPQPKAEEGSTSQRVREARPMVQEARKKAIEELVALGPSAVPALLRARDESIGARFCGDIFVDIIAKIGKPATPALIPALSGAKPVRFRAARALVRIKDPRAADSLLHASEDPDWRFAMTAAEALAALRETQAVPNMLELWNRKDANRTDKALLATYLGMVADKRATRPIMDELDKWSSYMKATGKWHYNAWTALRFVWALEKLGDPRAIPTLQRALSAAKVAPPVPNKLGELPEDPDEGLTEAIEKALQSLKGTTGRVISPEGLPLANADIRINHGELGILSSDKNGRFPYPRQKCYLLEATHPDWPNYMALTSPPLHESHVLLILQEVHAFEGKVLHQGSNNPVARSKVTLEIYVGGHTASGFVKLESTASKSDGSFSIENLIPGNKYRLVIYARGYGRVITDLFSARDGLFLGSDNSVFSKSIRMHPGRKVTFTVLDPEGKTVPNAMVLVGGKDWPYGRGQTDEAGETTIADIARPEQLLAQTRDKQIHISVHTEEIEEGRWKQKEHWYEPGAENKVTIQLKSSRADSRSRNTIPKQAGGKLNELFQQLRKLDAEKKALAEKHWNEMSKEQQWEYTVQHLAFYGYTYESVKQMRKEKPENIIDKTKAALDWRWRYIAMSEEHLTKDEKLQFMKKERELITEIAELGKPVVSFLIGKLPFTVEEFALLSIPLDSPVRSSGLSAEETILERKWARMALSKIGEAAVPDLVVALKHEDTWARRETATILGKIRDKDATRALIECLGDKDKAFRTTAARALAEIGDTLAIRPLVKALEDDHLNVQIAAVDGLAAFGDTRCIEPLEQLQLRAKGNLSMQITQAIQAIRAREYR